MFRTILVVHAQALGADHSVLQPTQACVAIRNPHLQRGMSMNPSAFFNALAHDTRLRTLMLLSQHPELCVCELTYAIGVSQPHLSRHLAQLREQGLVTDRRARIWIYYGINPALPDWAKTVLRDTNTGLTTISPFVDDTRALSAMPNRPDAPRCA